jgi:UDP-N-acetylmuramate dehydrogenase
MIELHENYPLKKWNTFGLEASCKKFVKLTAKAGLATFFQEIKQQNMAFYILGGGSNILFSKDFDGTIVHPAIMGHEIVDEDQEHVWLKAWCGENWDSLVEYCVSRGYGGIENLSFIPGNVGAVPIQNIGAYGSEAKDSIESVEFLNLETGGIQTFSNHACQFAYRDSIFKHALKGKTLILSVLFKLSKKPVFNVSYGPVAEEVKKMGGPALETVRKAIIGIREAKLPDPGKIGNGGSFFKNPIVPAHHFRQLVKSHATMPSYPVSETEVKIPAGWMIEQCGWKGYREGEAGVHDKQALVLVNHGKAKGEDILALAAKIEKSVQDKFGIWLEEEINII